MSQDPSITVPIKIDFPVQMPFRDTLVKMVDYVREPSNGYSQESIDKAIAGLEAVLSVVKERTGNKKIKGYGRMTK